MWEQNYLAAGGKLWASAAVAAVPIARALFLIGVRRMAAWKAMVLALLSASALAGFVFGAPLNFLAAAYL